MYLASLWGGGGHFEQSWNDFWLTLLSKKSWYIIREFPLSASRYFLRGVNTRASTLNTRSELALVAGKQE